MKNKKAPTVENILKAGIKYAKGYDKLLIMRALHKYQLVPKEHKRYYYRDIKPDDPNYPYIDQYYKKIVQNSRLTIEINEMEAVSIDTAKTYPPLPPEKQQEDHGCGRWSTQIYKPRISVRTAKSRGDGYYGMRYDERMAVSYTQLKRDICAWVEGTVNVPDDRFPKPKEAMENYYNNSKYAKKCTVVRLLEDPKTFRHDLNLHDHLIDINYYS